MASSGDVQVVPEHGAEVEQLVAVEAVPEHGAEVEQPVVVEACDGGTSSSATITKEESVMTTVLQGQHDTAPELDRNEDPAPAPEQTAPANMSASDEPEPEEEKPPVAKEEGEHNKAPDEDDHQESTRERMKRHRKEVAGRVWAPEKWGPEKLLKDWVDCAVFDRPLVPAGLLKARRALVAESCRRRPDRTSTSTTTVSSAAGSGPLRVRNGCS